MSRTPTIATLILSGTIAMSALPAHALGTYTFDGNSFAASSVNSNVSFDAFTPTNVTPFMSGFTNRGSGQATLHSGWTTPFDSSKYYTFTITPNSGMQMSFSSLTYDAAQSSAGPTTIEVRSSVDNFTSPLSIQAPGLNPTYNSNLPTSLTGAEFQSLTNPVTFRIYGYGATDTRGTLRLDNVRLNGSVNPVPVPFGFAPGLGIAVSTIAFQIKRLIKR